MHQSLWSLPGFNQPEWSFKNIPQIMSFPQSVPSSVFSLCPEWNPASGVWPRGFCSSVSYLSSWSPHTPHLLCFCWDTLVLALHMAWSGLLAFLFVLFNTPECRFQESQAPTCLVHHCIYSTRTMLGIEQCSNIFQINERIKAMWLEEGNLRDSAFKK